MKRSAVKSSALSLFQLSAKCICMITALRENQPMSRVSAISTVLAVWGDLPSGTWFSRD
jgi:hypothetical protein